MASAVHGCRSATKSGVSSSKRTEVNIDKQVDDAPKLKQVKLSPGSKNHVDVSGPDTGAWTVVTPSDMNAVKPDKSVVSDSSTISNDGSGKSVAVTPNLASVPADEESPSKQAALSVTTLKKDVGTPKYKLVVRPSRQHVAMMPRVCELWISFRESEPSVVVPFTLKGEMEHSEYKARQIFNIAVHMEGFNMQNIFSTDPHRFKHLVVGTKNDSRKVVNAKNNSDASFFTIGVVTESTLFGGKYSKEINIKPLARVWPRSHVVISQLLKYNDVVVSAYKDGIQFLTFRKPAEGGREIKPKSVPMDGRTHGPPVRGWDVEVPVFRGVEPFKLTEYMKLDPIFTELEAGDYVLVAFTIGGYRTKELNHASLNVQFAILLAKHDLTDDHRSSDAFPKELAEETALRVNDPTPMDVPEGQLIDWADSDAEYPDGPEF